MKINDIIENIESREGKRKSYDFKRMKALLEFLGNPQKNQKYLHVAGTNGKGSTSKFLYSMLKEGGYKVGLTTSPHLEKYNERIIVDGREIDDEDFIRIGQLVIEAEEKIIEEFEMLTFFEFITAMAFIYFKENKCDYSILEVGMGGASDSTNVVDAKDKIIDFITPISMDHMSYLGDSLEEIAFQKAGIIKEKNLVFSSNKDERVIKVLKKTSIKNEADFHDFKEYQISNVSISDKYTSYSLKYKNELIEDIKIGMLGFYQLENSALALAGLLELRQRKIINISDEKLKEGLYKSRWAGRMEIISENPKILLDGAHNLDGIQRLTENLKLFNYNKLYIITSILDDKEHEKMLLELGKYADEILLVSLMTKRKTELKILEEEAKKYVQNVLVIENLEKAIRKMLEESKEDDLVLIAGSLYLVSETKEIMKKVGLN